MAARTPRLALLGCAMALCLGLLAFAPATGFAAISLVGQTTGENGAGAATVTVNVPVGVQAGDLLHLALQGTGGTPIGAPPGWSTQYGTPTWYGYGAGFYKIAGSSEPLSYSIPLAASRRGHAELGAWRGVDAANPIDVDNFAGPLFGSSSSAVAPSVTTRRRGDIVVVGTTWGSNTITSTAPGGLTQSWLLASSGGSGGLTTHFGYFTQAAAGATPSKTFTASASTSWGAATTALQEPLPLTPSIGAAPTSPGNTRAPSWSFSVGEAGDTFECQLDRSGTIVSAW